jgi:hypothetical protein
MTSLRFAGLCAVLCFAATAAAEAPVRSVELRIAADPIRDAALADSATQGTESQARWVPIAQDFTGRFTDVTDLAIRSDDGPELLVLLGADMGFVGSVQEQWQDVGVYGQPVQRVFFGDEDASKLWQLTTEHRGWRLAIIVNGEVRSADQRSRIAKHSDSPYRRDQHGPGGRCRSGSHG